MINKNINNKSQILPWQEYVRVAVFGLSVLALSACAMPKRQGSGEEPLRGLNAESNGEVHTDLIRSMLDRKQYYAALAHIQEEQRSNGATRELTLLEAEARRRLGQNAPADKLYRSLLGTEYAADAEHGLGLIAATRDLNGAVQHLRAAVQRRPTNALFRNDLGYALMMSGRYQEALPELATAVELDQNSALGRNNLITLLLLTKDETRAKQIAKDSGISDEELAGLRRKAQAMAKPR